MSFTKTLRADLLADLATVVGVAEIGDGPQSLDQVENQSVYLQASGFEERGGDSDGPDDIGGTLGLRAQGFGLAIWVRASNPYDSIEDLGDDVSNAIEAPASNLNTRAGVLHATVSEWTEMETSEDIGGEIGHMSATVTVVYEYTRGGL